MCYVFYRHKTWGVTRSKIFPRVFRPEGIFLPRNTSCRVTIKHVTHRKYKLSYLLHSCSKLCSITSSPSLHNNDSTRLNIDLLCHYATRDHAHSHSHAWNIFQSRSKMTKNKLFITFPTTFIDYTHTETRKSVIHNKIWGFTFLPNKEKTHRGSDQVRMKLFT